MTFAVSVNPISRFLVRRRTTFTWIVPILLLISSWKWGIWNEAAYLGGLVFIVAGEAVRIWAAGYIQKDDVIATGGPYAFVRNPLYFGSFLLTVGYVLLSGLGVSYSPLIAVLAWAAMIALFLLFHLAAIFSEERFLKEKFGEPYAAYLRSVPRLFPKPWPAKQTSARDAGHFAWQQAMRNREMTTAGITLAVCVVFALEFFIKYHTIHLS
jgi:protein-S-isoprenylcysteine O-methyltransferase Ste14